MAHYEFLLLLIVETCIGSHDVMLWQKRCLFILRSEVSKSDGNQPIATDHKLKWENFTKPL